MNDTRIKAGDKYVWEPDALTPPAVFVKISQVRRHGQCVVAECQQSGKRWKRRFTLPLPPTMVRRHWTNEEIRECQYN